MPVALRSDEHGSRLRPFPGARRRRRGQWTPGARQPQTAFVTAAKASNDRMRGSQFSSCKYKSPISPIWPCAASARLGGREIDGLGQAFIKHSDDVEKESRGILDEAERERAATQENYRFWTIVFRILYVFGWVAGIAGILIGTNEDVVVEGLKGD